MEPIVPQGLVTAAIRSSGPRALAILVSRWGNFHDAEDAVQDALAAAARQWPREGTPDRPTSWLVTVATRRMTDAVRSDVARRARESHVAAMESTVGSASPVDDTLALYLLCCHPALSRSAQVALTLRCVGGLTTREIARGLVATEATVAQRVSRAKHALRSVDRPFRVDDAGGLATRMHVVLDVLGVIHTESHSAATGDSISRPALGREALRLARQLQERADASEPWYGEVLGLVALILLTDARSAARVDSRGDLVALAQQDRSLWDAASIAEGADLVAHALFRYPLGPFQLRAAIAAVHDEAGRSEDTRWSEILGLYDILRVIDPGPVVELARVVALAEVVGPDRALVELAAIRGAPARRVAAVRAHLRSAAGDTEGAAVAYDEAASLAVNTAERRWFEAQLPR